VFGWALYDFANSGYATVVLTAVFSAYFVGVVASNPTLGTLLWTVSLSLSHFIVMVTIPFIGASSDRSQRRRGLLVMTTLGCVLCTAALALAGPGAVVLAMVMIVLSNMFFCWGESIISSYLPSLARAHAIGRVSGWGWGLGYVGGMLTLGICLVYVIKAQAAGQSADQFVPVTMLITAGIFAVAAVVSIALLKDHPGSVQSAKPAWQRLRQTWHSAQQYRDFMWLLACTVAYMAGVAVAIALAAIYAQQVIGFNESEIMLLIFVLNIAAVVGALALGYGQDIIGHRAALATTLVGWGLTCIVAASVSTKGGFWVAGVIAGLCMGASQSVGRAMVGLLAPANKLGEFYGLWTLATRLASIIGPLAYGVLTWVSLGNQRLAMAATTLFFVVGLLLLVPIQMKRGQAAAEAAGNSNNTPDANASNSTDV
jgi:UMF1 family MFS transporter